MHMVFRISEDVRDVKTFKWLIDDDKLAVVGRLTEWAESKGHTILELAMSWHTSHPLIASVIAASVSLLTNRFPATCAAEAESRRKSYEPPA